MLHFPDSYFMESWVFFLMYKQLIEKFLRGVNICPG